MVYPALAIRDVSETPYAATHGATSSATSSADVSAIEELGEQITILSAHIHAATQRLLVLVAQFDRKRGWELDGQRSCAHWLALRTGIDLGAAREKVRAARALEALPLTSAAMSRGELSFSQVRALTRVATPENEADLLPFACGATTAQLERMVRSYRSGNRLDDAAAERELRAARTVSVFPDEDGMYRICGRLTPEIGALLMRALEAAGDALFRERRADSAGDTTRDAARRRADALGLLAERALAAGFQPASQNLPVSGTRAERYQVVLHVDAATLSAGDEPGRSELEDGTHLSAETSRRISCDASVVQITTNRQGAVLDAGRKTRTISPALRRALNTRDSGCRFPGCGLRFTDAHHVQHWADGGATSLSNCLLLCAHHHTLVHEGGWRVQWWGEGRPVFSDPRGQMHFEGSRRAVGAGARYPRRHLLANVRTAITKDEFST